MDRLPDELVLDIVAHLQVILPPPATLSSTRAKDLYAENQQRLEALSALCVTSKRFYRIARASLYSTFIINPGCKRLQIRMTRFLRTMITCPELRPVVLSLQKIGPVESKDPPDDLIVSEARRMLVKDEDFEDWNALSRDNMIDAYFTLLLAYTFNVKQLVWQTGIDKSFIEIDLSQRFLKETTEGGFSNLSSLFLSNKHEFQHSVLPHMSPEKFPSLRKLQLHGSLDLHEWLNPQHNKPTVAMLSSLHLSSSHLELIRLPAILNECQRLQEFIWSSDNIYTYEGKDLTDLHAALSKHKHSLKKLEIKPDGPLLPDIWTGQRTLPQFKSLRDFSVLATLDLTGPMLLGVSISIPHSMSMWTQEWLDFWDAHWSRYTPSYRISEILPRSLKQLMVRDHLGFRHDALALKQLAEDCHQFPHLEWIRWQDKFRFMDDPFFRQVTPPSDRIAELVLTRHHDWKESTP